MGGFARLAVYCVGVYCILNILLSAGVQPEVVRVAAVGSAVSLLGLLAKIKV